jgi:hypothetical protein
MSTLTDSEMNEMISGGVASIKAPKPPPKRDPWLAVEDKTPRPQPASLVKVRVLKAHQGGSEWRLVGSAYDVPHSRAEQLSAVGFVAFEVESNDWFSDEPDPSTADPAPRVYDGFLGPDVRVCAFEADLPVCMTPGSLWFHRGQSVFWIPTTAGEEKTYPEAIAVLLEATATCELVDELSERGKSFRERRFTTNAFNVIY